MNALRKPTTRRCEICGREETWDEDAENWRIDGEAGDTYCLHEWDITGAFSPFGE